MRFSTFTVAATFALGGTPVLAQSTGALGDLVHIIGDLVAVANDVPTLNILDILAKTTDAVATLPQLTTDLSNGNLGTTNLTDLITTVENTICTPLNTAITTIQGALNSVPLLGGVLTAIVNTVLSPLASALNTLIGLINGLPNPTGIDISGAIKCLQKIICLITPTATGCPVTKRAVAEVAARAGGATLPIAVAAF